MPKPQFIPKPSFLGSAYGWCPDHARAWRIDGDGTDLWCHECATGHAKPRAPMDAAVVRGGGKRRSHYSAVRTTCARGHSHPSKTEARACAYVYGLQLQESVIYRNVRLPLWALPPTDAGIPHYCNVDFAIIGKDTGKIVALIDAKCGKRSRDWERGRAAVQATYGITVEELEV